MTLTLSARDPVHRPRIDDIGTSVHRDRLLLRNAFSAQARRERSGLAGLLGTNEQHANEFNEAFGDLVGLLNRRSYAVDDGGTGLWSEADYPRIKLATEKPTAKAVSAPTAQNPAAQAKGKNAFVSQRASVSILERLAAQSADSPAVDRSAIQREVAEKLERLRSDQRASLCTTLSDARAHFRVRSGAARHLRLPRPGSHCLFCTSDVWADAIRSIAVRAAC